MHGDNLWCVASLRRPIPRCDDFDRGVQVADPLGADRQRNRSCFGSVIDHHDDFVHFGQGGVDDQLMPGMQWRVFT